MVEKTNLTRKYVVYYHSYFIDLTLETLGLSLPYLKNKIRITPYERLNLR